MSGIEPEVKDFMKRIVRTLFLGLLWLTVNMILGIYLGYMFFDGGVTLGNILFYIFFITSLAGLSWIYYKTWKTKFPHG